MTASPVNPVPLMDVFNAFRKSILDSAVGMMKMEQLGQKRTIAQTELGKVRSNQRFEAYPAIREEKERTLKIVTDAYDQIKASQEKREDDQMFLTKTIVSEITQARPSDVSPHSGHVTSDERESFRTEIKTLQKHVDSLANETSELRDQLGRIQGEQKNLRSVTLQVPVFQSRLDLCRGEVGKMRNETDRLGNDANYSDRHSVQNLVNAQSKDHASIGVVEEEQQRLRVLINDIKSKVEGSGSDPRRQDSESKATRDINGRLNTLESLTNSCRTSHQTIADLQKGQQDLAKLVKEVESKAEFSTQVPAKQNREINAIRSALTEMKTDQVKSQGAIDNIKGVIETIRSDLSRQQRQGAVHDSSLNNVLDDIKDIGAKLDRIDGDVTRIGSSWSEQEDKITQLETNAREDADKLSDIRYRLNTCRVDVDKLQAIARTSGNLANNSTNDVAGKAADIAVAKVLENLNPRLSSCREDINKLRAGATELAANITSNGVGTASGAGQAGLSPDDLEELEQRLDTLESRFDGRLNKMQEELQERKDNEDQREAFLFSRIDELDQKALLLMQRADLSDKGIAARNNATSQVEGSAVLADLVNLQGRLRSVEETLTVSTEKQLESRNDASGQGGATVKRVEIEQLEKRINTNIEDMKKVINHKAKILTQQSDVHTTAINSLSARFDNIQTDDLAKKMVDQMRVMYPAAADAQEAYNHTVARYRELEERLNTIQGDLVGKIDSVATVAADAQREVAQALAKPADLPEDIRQELYDIKLQLDASKNKNESSSDDTQHVNTTTREMERSVERLVRSHLPNELDRLLTNPPHGTKEVLARALEECAAGRRRPEDRSTGLDPALEKRVDELEDALNGKRRELASTLRSESNGSLSPPKRLAEETKQDLARLVEEFLVARSKRSNGGEISERSAAADKRIGELEDRVDGFENAVNEVLGEQSKTVKAFEVMLGNVQMIVDHILKEQGMEEVDWVRLLNRGQADEGMNTA